MGLGFEEAVEKVHTALERRDTAGVVEGIANLTVGMQLNDLTSSAVHDGLRPLSYAAMIGFAGGCEALIMCCPPPCSHDQP